jgi:hypothetical protein
MGSKKEINGSVQATRCMAHAPEKRISGFRCDRLVDIRQTRPSLNLSQRFLSGVHFFERSLKIFIVKRIDGAV